MTDNFDLCEYCCEWVNAHEGKSPQTVADNYPKMMRKVLRHEFRMSKDAADIFIEDACYSNWDKLHETRMEKIISTEMYARELLSDVFYCSDRWSWDRVLRIQWLYQRIFDRLRTEDRS